MDTNQEAISPGQAVELTYNGQSIGVLEVESRWVPDKALEALRCYGTSSLEHPGVLMIATERGKYYLGGKARRPHLCWKRMRVRSRFSHSSPLAPSCFCWQRRAE